MWYNRFTMTNENLMETVAEEVLGACIDNGVSDKDAFDAAINSVRNVSETFREKYAECMEGHACEDICSDCHDEAWDRANDAAWDEIWEAAFLAVIGRGFNLAREKGFSDDNKTALDAEVGKYVDSVLD
jgi:hypothetical protein